VHQKIRILAYILGNIITVTVIYTMRPSLVGVITLLILGQITKSVHVQENRNKPGIAAPEDSCPGY